MQIETETPNVVVSQFNYYSVNPLTGRRQVYSGVLSADGSTISVGLSECSHKDKFVKKEGRTLATKRAIDRPILHIRVEKRANRDFVEAVKVYQADDAYTRIMNKVGGKYAKQKTGDEKLDWIASVIGQQFTY